MTQPTCGFGLGTSTLPYSVKGRSDTAAMPASDAAMRLTPAAALAFASAAAIALLALVIGLTNLDCSGLFSLPAGLLSLLAGLLSLLTGLLLMDPTLLGGLLPTGLPAMSALGLLNDGVLLAKGLGDLLTKGLGILLLADTYAAGRLGL